MQIRCTVALLSLPFFLLTSLISNYHQFFIWKTAFTYEHIIYFPLNYTQDWFFFFILTDWLPQSKYWSYLPNNLLPSLQSTATLCLFKEISNIIWHYLIRKGLKLTVFLTNIFDCISTCKCSISFLHLYQSLYSMCVDEWMVQILILEYKIYTFKIFKATLWLTGRYHTVVLV